MIGKDAGIGTVVGPGIVQVFVKTLFLVLVRVQVLVLTMVLVLVCVMLQQLAICAKMKTNFHHQSKMYTYVPKHVWFWYYTSTNTPASIS